MVMDANLILRGEFNSALQPAVNGDAPADSLTIEATGNVVVDVKKTGLSNPMCAVLVMTEESDGSAYTDDTTLVIQESDALDRNWQTVVTFPTLYSHIRRVYVKTSVGFALADIGGTLTSQAPYTGRLLYFDPALAEINGVGWLYAAMVDSGDYFDDIVGQTCNGASTGVSKVATSPAGTTMESGLPVQMQPRTYVRKFHTNKRYVRSWFSTIDGDIGKCWIYLTNAHESFNTPLGC